MSPSQSTRSKPRSTFTGEQTVSPPPSDLASQYSRRSWSSVDSEGQIVDIRDKSLENIIKLLPQKYSKVAKIALDMVQATIDCNWEWVDFKSSVRGQRDRNCHRVDIGLKDEKPPSIDDVGRTDELWTKSRHYLREPRSYFMPPDPYMQREYRTGMDHLRVIARRLLAALFYLSNVLENDMSKGSFKTNLCCRLLPQSDGALTIMAQRPTFHFHPVRTLLPGILDEQTLLGPIELDISEGEHWRTVEVLFPRRYRDWEPIGGF
ncbi:hypothetical protein F5Y09DRAFT_332280 [Xylaria sp. FL1042]|nr:hypothetical protein F5Y09DRAFT_332280 [Xylaria sp. FL1042]